MPLSPFSKWLHDWIARLDERLGKLTVRGLFVVVTVGLLSAIAAVFRDSVIMAFLDQYVLGGVGWLLRRPIGFVLAGAVIWVLVLITLSWWETSPFLARKRERKARQEAFALPRPVGPTPEDKNAIAILRGYWNQGGHLVASQIEYLSSLIDNILYERGFPNLDYFRTTKTVCEEARKAMGTALNPQEVRSLKEVQDAFVDWFMKYKRLIQDIARIRKERADWGILDSKEEYVASWRHNNAKFFENIEVMILGWPEHGRLPIDISRRHFFSNDDDLTGDFVWPPEWFVHQRKAIPALTMAARVAVSSLFIVTVNLVNCFGIVKACITLGVKG